MPQQQATATENNFRNGLITQATGLNFPENACTDTSNSVFNFDGSVTRRLGFDFEANFSTKVIDRTLKVVTSFLWKNVTGDGNINLVVKQVGNTLYFYNVDPDSSVSDGALITTVVLTPVSGVPVSTSVAAVEAQFAPGNGYLFVTHPYCEPVYISFDNSTKLAIATNITIKIRDFEGDTADPNAISDRPAAGRTTMGAAHLYNLYNQGWTLTNLNTWDTNLTTMPSNADIMWAFKNSSDAFDTATVANVVNGNSPAPKGHYIINLSSSGRNTLVSTDDGTTQIAVTETNTSYWRPSTCAFFSGRIFFSGVNYTLFSSRIYFSQIIERQTQFGSCYQKNDPTAEDNFDLLPDDGGVIDIKDAGRIIKLYAIVGGLLVFAERGVWFVTGSTGIGFTANDYTVQKISSVTSLTSSSFVDIGGSISWWTTEGIYVVSVGENGNPGVKSITFDKIKSFYDDIPTEAKATAKGTYNYITNEVQWIYRSTAAADLTATYTYDSILNLNLMTGAFYPWTIPASTVSINGIILLDGSTGALTQETVIDGVNTVIDGVDDVITFVGVDTGIVPQFAYIVSYSDSGSYKFTFAAARSTDYVDWKQYDAVGTDYTSYFISGFKIRGGALRKWQDNWLRLYARNNTDTQFTITGLWDFSTDTSTKRWNTPQTLIFNSDNYGTLSKRVKMRGHGQALQFKVTSVTGQPFDIIGWAEMDSINAIP